ncbi:MAG: nucleotidyltransferase family protein [Vicingaceae bacterium]
MNLKQKNSEALKSLCQEHYVDTLYLFGSATTEKFSASSDIDLLVKFKPFSIESYFRNYTLFKEKLKVLFQRKIDLVEEQTLKNPVLIKSINKNKELIYG